MTEIQTFTGYWERSSNRDLLDIIHAEYDFKMCKQGFTPDQTSEKWLISPFVRNINCLCELPSAHQVEIFTPNKDK